MWEYFSTPKVFLKLSFQITRVQFDIHYAFGNKGERGMNYCRLISVLYRQLKTKLLACACSFLPRLDFKKNQSKKY